MSPNGKPLPIRGAQLFTEDPPGFLWWGRIRMSPGLWIDARDMSVAGLGSMRVLLDDTVPIADAEGPQLDEGAALRLLAEMPWYPTALFDQRYVRWRAIDDRHAEATLEFAPGRTVRGVFEFGADGLPLRMSGQRYKDGGEMRPWGGVYRDWRTVEGLRVPFEAEVSWELPAGPIVMPIGSWIRCGLMLRRRRCRLLAGARGRGPGPRRLGRDRCITVLASWTCVDGGLDVD